jgi:hypothetical protein
VLDAYHLTGARRWLLAAQTGGTALCLVQQHG